MSNELYHHGILGMKWGKKNGPPYPLDSSDHSSSERKSGWRRSLGGGRNESLYNRKTVKKKKVSAQPTAQKAKTQYDKDNDEERKKLIRNVAIGVGAVAAASLLYKAGRMYGRNYVDKVIKAGTKIQTLQANPNHVIKGKQFYGAIKSGDKATYKAIFGMKKNDVGKTIIKKNVTSTVGSDIKRASRHSATKIYNDLKANNPEFRKAVEQSPMKRYEQKRSDMFKGLGVLRKSRTEYDSFNRIVLNSSGDKSGDKARKMFYKELKKNGYGAVLDVNDGFYSGLDTDASIIFAKNKIKDYSVSKVKPTDLAGSSAKYVGLTIVKNPILATAAASGVGYGIVKSYDKKKEKSQK